MAATLVAGVLNTSDRSCDLRSTYFIVFLDGLRATALPSTRYYSWGEDFSVIKRQARQWVAELLHLEADRKYRLKSN